MIGAALLAVAALAPRKVVRDRRRAILITAVSSLVAFVALSAITGILKLPGALTDRPDTIADLRVLSVRLQETNRISLRITDDGEGFDAAGSRDSAGFGLISMREHSQSLGGEFRVTSAPGRGTCVEVVLP